MRVLSPRIEPPETLELGIDREHRDAMAVRDQLQAERLDEGRLADAGHARDAEAERRRAPARQQRVEQRVGALRDGRRGSIRAA